MSTRLGVDVGGTFTDVVLIDEATGEIRVAKEPTTPESPDEGVIRGVGEVISNGGLSAVEYFLHGTTVGINALLTRSGAVVGLLATEGHRDTLELARGDRPDSFDLFWKAAPPLVPRHLRVPVKERILFDGSVEQALAEDEVEAALVGFEQEGVTAIAVAFLNAYANPEHELQAERVLRRAGFEGDITLSHRVSGEYREYERTSTTVVDAYVRPRTASYLAKLENRLRDGGLDGGCLLTRSGGGAMTFGEAAERPFEAIISGPVAGVEGAANLARELELDEVVTIDVGGTSTDVCLIVEGRPLLMYEGRIEGLPIQSPWVDVRSIGSGGGSIVHLDEGGLLSVGPRSAGAQPGPACYGRGGTEPTVTDAACCLGLMGDGRLAGGVELDRDAAVRSFGPVAEALGQDVLELCRGVLRIAAANMADAIREVLTERGQDPRTAVLMAFGGAGPLFASLVAAELEVPRIVIPPLAGNFSAWGLLGADLVQTAGRTYIRPLDDEVLAATGSVVEEIFTALEGRMTTVPDSARREVLMDLRYAGQEHALTISVGADGSIDGSAAAIAELFVDAYVKAFTEPLDVPIEIVTVRGALRIPIPPPGEPAEAARAELAGERTAPAWSFARGEELDFRVVDRAALGAEDCQGPALVVEQTATTYLDAGSTARVVAGGALEIDATGGKEL
ncbi:MAG: hydantoinase/oxoprolinase family protein [Actinobacteria bacterium]|nr:hydantoinase/oxoprolinase family protein [Actinomycetota bacterium]